MLDFGVFSIQGRGSSEWVCFRDCPGPQPELLCGPPGTCKPLFIYANSMVHVCKLNASAPAIFPEEPLHVRPQQDHQLPGLPQAIKYSAPA